MAFKDEDIRKEYEEELNEKEKETQKNQPVSKQIKVRTERRIN